MLESISRDCEPSPPATLKSSQNRPQNNNFTHFNAYGNSKLSYQFNSPNSSGTNLLTSSQSQVLYNQHYPIPLRNLYNLTNLTQQQQKQQQQNCPNYNTNEIGLHLISQPGSHLINHPNFYHQFNRSTSPTKSTSISEISPYAHYNSSKQLIKSNGNAQQQSGVVVYYSPEEASNSLMITDLDSVGNKFASETELAKLKEHLIYNNAETSNLTKQQNSNKKYFFSKRPMSFKKALEITEQLDRNSSHGVPNNNNLNNKNASKSNDAADSNKDDNRKSQYEMNYEISV